MIEFTKRHIFLKINRSNISRTDVNYFPNARIAVR